MLPALGGSDPASGGMYLGTQWQGAALGRCCGSAAGVPIATPVCRLLALPLVRFPAGWHSNPEKGLGAVAASSKGPERTQTPACLGYVDRPMTGGHPAGSSCSGLSPWSPRASGIVIMLCIIINLEGGRGACACFQVV